MKIKQPKKNIPQDIISRYGTCQHCGCKEVQFEHISDLDKYTKRIAREVWKMNDCHVAFCPHCESLGFIEKGA